MVSDEYIKRLILGLLVTNFGARLFFGCYQIVGCFTRCESERRVLDIFSLMDLE